MKKYIKDKKRVFYTSSKIFTILILVAVISFSSIITIGFVNNKNITLSNASEKRNRNLIDTAKILDGLIENKYTALQGIASLKDVQSMDWNIQYPTLLHKAEEFGFKHLFIMNKNGICYYAENNTIRDQSSDNFFINATGNKRSIIEPFVIGKSEFSIVTLVVPLLDENGVFIGNLCGVIDLEDINNLIQDVSISGDDEVFLINSYGNFVAHKNMEVIYDGVNLNSVLTGEYKSLSPYASLLNHIGEKGIEEDLIEIDNNLNYVSSKTLDNAPWLLVISEKEREIISPLIKNLIEQVCLGIISIILVVYIAYRFKKWHNLNTREISILARELSNYNLNYSIDISEKNTSDDFYEVMEELNVAVGVLRKMIYSSNKKYPGKLEGKKELALLELNESSSSLVNNIYRNLDEVVDSVSELAESLNNISKLK